MMNSEIEMKLLVSALLYMHLFLSTSNSFPFLMCVVCVQVRGSRL